LREAGQAAARRASAWWLFATALASGLAACAALRLTQLAGYIAAVMVTSRRHQPAFLAAAFAANVIADLSFGQSLAISAFLSACSSLEMLVAIALMRLYQPRNWIHLEQPRVLACFWGTVCVIAPFVSALLASAGLYYTVQVPMWGVFGTWWIAHTLGLAVITLPLLIVFRDGAQASLAAISSKGAIASLLMLLAVTSGVFLQTRYPLLFLLFPAMVLVPFNAGFLGVAIALLIVTVESTTLTYLGTGPMALIADVTSREATVLMQLVLAQMLVIGFLVGTNLGASRKLERELDILATTDALTGLSTRRRFDEHFQTVWAEALRERHPVAVMMFDADFFKACNDSYGHLEGDGCIKAIAAIIRGIARRQLDLAVRCGRHPPGAGRSQHRTSRKPEPRGDAVDRHCRRSARSRHVCIRHDQCRGQGALPRQARRAINNRTGQHRRADAGGRLGYLVQRIAFGGPLKSDDRRSKRK